MAERNLRLSNSKLAKPPNLLFRAFGGLKVRQKLATLHNIFFFVLATSVYLSLIPLFPITSRPRATVSFGWYGRSSRRTCRRLAIRCCEI